MHKAQALLLSCIDFRFQKMMGDFMEVDEHALKSFDRVALAGGVKQLIHPDNKAIKDFILGQINISIKLHDPEAIYLMNHEDCGAYGANNSFAVHQEDLLATVKLLSQIYPQKKFRLLIATFNGIREISTEDNQTNMQFLLN